MISHDERLSAYNASTDMISSPLEYSIIKRCSDGIVENFVKTLPTPKILYECSKLSVHGTEYQHGQFVVLPESSNTLPVFGKILKLLSCEQFGYFVIQNTSNKYCSKTDLYFVIENQQFTVVPCLQLPSYLPIEAYPLGAAKKMSLSLRNYILEHRN